jgi:hypothetical protein
VPEAPLAADADRETVTAAIGAFELAWEGSGDLLGAEHRAVTDRTATDRWVLRFKGAEKDVIAIWLTLGQRTLVAEAEVMPAPDESAVEIYALLGTAYAMGPEQGLYLVARVPAASVDVEELDRLCGAIVSELDEVYPTVMSLGFPAHYRRRPRR